MSSQLERKDSVGQTSPGDHVTDAELRGVKCQPGEHAVQLQVAARLDNLAVLRTLVGAMGAFEDLDIDAVADLRLAVDEACTRLIRSATPDATLVVVVDPRDDELVVEASTSCKTYEVVSPGSFSWHVLTSLTDNVRTFHDGVEPGAAGSVFGIVLTARRAASGG